MPVAPSLPASAVLPLSLPRPCVAERVIAGASASHRECIGCIHACNRQVSCAHPGTCATTMTPELGAHALRHSSWAPDTRKANCCRLDLANGRRCTAAMRLKGGCGFLSVSFRSSLRAHAPSARIWGRRGKERCAEQRREARREAGPFAKD